MGRGQGPGARGRLSWSGEGPTLDGARNGARCSAGEHGRSPLGSSLPPPPPPARTLLLLLLLLLRTPLALLLTLLTMLVVRMTMAH